MSRKKPEIPNLTMSFLDLLLSALGGVALLTVLFAATLSNNAKQIANLNYRQLVVEFTDGTLPNSVLIGPNAEVGVMIGNEKNDFVNPYEDPPTAQALQATYRPSAKRHRVEIRAPTDQALTARVWLQRLAHPGEPPDPILVQLLRVGGPGIGVKLSWMGQEVQCQLRREQGFIAEVPLPDAR